MMELAIEATRNNLPKVLSFVDGKLESLGCSMETQMAIDVSVEEIFVNIASYAYEPETGDVLIQLAVLENPLAIEITFIDSGKRYNPLEKEDPDISLPLHKRKKGGLGIFMMKLSMDNVTYEYKDEKNVLTLSKNID